MKPEFLHQLPPTAENGWELAFLESLDWIVGMQHVQQQSQREPTFAAASQSPMLASRARAHLEQSAEAIARIQET